MIRLAVALCLIAVPALAADKSGVYSIEGTEAFSGVASINAASVTATVPNARGFDRRKTCSITLGGVIYNVKTVTDATHLTIFIPKQGLPAATAGVAYTWYPVAPGFVSSAPANDVRNCS